MISTYSTNICLAGKNKSTFSTYLANQTAKTPVFSAIRAQLVQNLDLFAASSTDSLK